MSHVQYFTVYSQEAGWYPAVTIQCTARGLVPQVICTVYRQEAGVPGNKYSVQPGRWCPRYSILQCTVRRLVGILQLLYSVQKGGWCHGYFTVYTTRGPVS